MSQKTNTKPKSGTHASSLERLVRKAWPFGWMAYVYEDRQKGRYRLQTSPVYWTKSRAVEWAIDAMNELDDDAFIDWDCHKKTGKGWWKFWKYCFANVKVRDATND